MSSPGSNPPHAPRDDPARPRRQDAHEAKLEAKELAQTGERLPWYKRLFQRG
jgi:hypothetical protein